MISKVMFIQQFSSHLYMLYTKIIDYSYEIHIFFLFLINREFFSVFPATFMDSQISRHPGTFFLFPRRLEQPNRPKYRVQQKYNRQCRKLVGLANNKKTFPLFPFPYLYLNLHNFLFPSLSFYFLFNFSFLFILNYCSYVYIHYIRMHEYMELAHVFYPFFYSLL